MAESARLKKKPFLLSGAVLSVLVLVGLIGWMIESRATILRDGEEVVLKTEPIDPRDLLRGRYVRLNYDISSLPTDLFDEPPASVLDEARSNDGLRFVRRATEVFVTVEPGDDGFHKAVAVSFARPDAGVFIRAKTQSGMFWGRENANVRLDYGVGRFYTNEQLAPELEARMRDGEITTVVVAVDEAGTAQIKAFQQDGVNIVTERLY